MRELSSLREEVVYASALAREHSKERFDAKTSEWKDESLLQPGKKVWIEIVDMPYPAAAHMPTRKMRALATASDLVSTPCWVPCCHLGRIDSIDSQSHAY